MNNQYAMYSSAKLDMGVVKAKVSTLPTIGLSDNDRYWYDNRVYIYNEFTTSWTVKEPKNGLRFMLETNGHTYVCYNGYFQDITLGTDATTVNGHTIESDVPADAKFTDTIYDDTTVKESIANLQTDTHTHFNKISLDKVGEDVDGNLTYNGQPIKPASDGATDYTQLSNKPKLNGVELSGNKTLSELGIQPSGTYLTAIPSEYVTDSELIAKGYATISQIPNVSNKLESANIKAGSNITVEISGNDVTINSTASGSSGGSIIADSSTNGNIVVDGVEMNVYTLPSDIAKTSDIPNVNSKLEASNIKQGDNVTVTVNGNDVTISANTSSIDSTARQSISDLTTVVNGKAESVHTHSISNVTGLQSALDNKVDDSQIGVTNGIASLGADGKVPSSQLPISSTLALGETNATAYYGDKGKTAYDHSQLVGGNPHNVSKADVGLGNVQNVDTTTTSNITDSSNKRFATDAQLTALGNISGINTGDETKTSIQNKLGAASSTTDGYLTSTDYSSFTNKVDKIDGSSLVPNGEIEKIHAPSIIGTKVVDETNIGDKKVLQYNATAGIIEYSDANEVTATDLDVTGVATVVTDIQTSTNSTPMNAVSTQRDVRDIIKGNNVYIQNSINTLSDQVNNLPTTRLNSLNGDISLIGTDGIIITNDSVNNTISISTVDPTDNGIAPADIPSKVIRAGDQQLNIIWTDPSDLTANGVTYSIWDHTTLVRKIGSYPTSESDGTVVVVNFNRNQYAENGFLDTGLTNGVTYYYKLFIYAQDGTVNRSSKNNMIGIPKKYLVYGVRIDETNSNIESAVTYTDDAIGMTAGSTDWDSTPIFANIQPCVFKNGAVQYYLNKNNFNYKANGVDSADITTGADGDVMIEIPKMAYMMYRDGNYLYVKVTNDPDAKLIDDRFCFNAHTRSTEGDRQNLYCSAYGGYSLSSKLRSLSGKTQTSSLTLSSFRTQAQENGSGYDLLSFYPIVLIQCLYLIKYKNLNSQYVLGNGAIGTTGVFNDKGFTYGVGNVAGRTKLFGMEDLWGALWIMIDGIKSNESRQPLIAKNNFADSLSYSVSTSILPSSSGGYINKCQGTNELGFLPYTVGGTSTTYYSDGFWSGANTITLLGGRNGLGVACGLFCWSMVEVETIYNANIGARLMYL